MKNCKFQLHIITMKQRQGEVVMASPNFFSEVINE